MPKPEPLLKTRQVAEALGVSASTIKRWVDSGALPASRTVGKHRLVPLHEAVRMAESQSLPDARVKALLGLANPPLTAVDDALREALLVALCGGHVDESCRLLTSAYGFLKDGAKLADEVIGPVMERVGHDWSTGRLDVFQEHRASRIVESSLNGLIASVSHRPLTGAPIALGATPSGDPYTIPGLLAELALREDGWEVSNLGPDLPLDSLARAVRAYRPRLIWLSIHHCADADLFAREFAAFYAEAIAVDSAICLGGPGLDPAFRGLPGVHIGKRLSDLTGVARGLIPPPNATNDQPTNTDSTHGMEPRDKP